LVVYISDLFDRIYISEISRSIIFLMFIFKVIIQSLSYYLVQMNKDIKKNRKRENISTVNHSNKWIA